jgi:hypothetical protein
MLKKEFRCCWLDNTPWYSRANWLIVAIWSISINKPSKKTRPLQDIDIVQRSWQPKETMPNRKSSDAIGSRKIVGSRWRDAVLPPPMHTINTPKHARLTSCFIYLYQSLCVLIGSSEYCGANIRMKTLAKMRTCLIVVSSPRYSSVQSTRTTYAITCIDVEIFFID